MIDFGQQKNAFIRSFIFTRHRITGAPKSQPTSSLLPPSFPAAFRQAISFVRFAASPFNFGASSLNSSLLPQLSLPIKPTNTPSNIYTILLNFILSFSLNSVNSASGGTFAEQREKREQKHNKQSPPILLGLPSASPMLPADQANPPNPNGSPSPVSVGGLQPQQQLGVRCSGKKCKREDRAAANAGMNGAKKGKMNMKRRRKKQGQNPHSRGDTRSFVRQGHFFRRLIAFILIPSLLPLLGSRLSLQLPSAATAFRIHFPFDCDNYGLVVVGFPAFPSFLFTL